MKIINRKEEIVRSGLVPFVTTIMLTEYASVEARLTRLVALVLGSLMLIAIASTLENKILWIIVCVIVAVCVVIAIYNVIRVQRKALALADIQNQAQAEVEKWFQVVAHKLEASEASVSADELADYRDRQYLLRMAEKTRFGKPQV